MRVFATIRHANDPSQFYGGLWSANFYPALRELGCEVVESQVDLLPASRFMGIAGDFTPEETAVRGEVTGRILDELHAAHLERPVDLFLSYFYNAHFDPAGFDEIERMGIPAVNFYCNSIYQFELVAAVAARARFSWFPERDAAASYARVGARVVRVQMGADPALYRPTPPVEPAKREASACFVGQRYADRDRWVAALLRAKVPTVLYGPGWGFPSPPQAITTPKEDNAVYLGRQRHVPGSVSAYGESLRRSVAQLGWLDGLKRMWRQVAYRQETRKLLPLFAPHAKGSLPVEHIGAVFSQYEVVLNFSNVWADGQPGSTLVPHVRLRDFEAPMSGACYLTGHTEEIAEFYRIGHEIDTYRDAAELVDKTRFYLTHPDAAESLRRAGLARARQDHTWTRRFAELFAKIGLAVPA